MFTCVFDAMLLVPHVYVRVRRYVACTSCLRACLTLCCLYLMFMCVFDAMLLAPHVYVRN